MSSLMKLPVRRSALRDGFIGFVGAFSRVNSFFGSCWLCFVLAVISTIRGILESDRNRSIEVLVLAVGVIADSSRGQVRN